MRERHDAAKARKPSTNPASIVVCAYTADRWSTLRRAIDVTLKQSSFEDELLVVVDHNDALLAKCREHLGECRVLPNRHSLGLSGARNTALDEARGAIVVFLDDDAIPMDGWLDALRTPYYDKRIYGVGGFAKPHWVSGQPAWFPDEFLWVVGCSHKGLPSASNPVRNLIGANMSFRKSAFDRVGGFVEQMGRIRGQLLGCEETEFSIRLTQACPDAVILYEPSSQIEHHVTRPRTSLAYFFRRCWAEGISKAEVSRRVGRSNALSTERYYVMRVLPKGIWNGLHDAFTGDFWGAVRSAMISFGLVVTTVGYCVGAVYHPSTRGRSTG
jgi:glycosyltransferase involved in cell wall biosynthesis